MSYAMLVSGRLRFPEGALAQALARPVDPSRRPDWIGSLPGRGQAIDRVESYLEALPKWIIAAAGSWVAVETLPEAHTLAIYGVLGEDDFLEHGTTLAECFRVAAEVGAEGELFYLEEQVPFHSQEPELCYVVRVRPGASTIEHVPEEEQVRVIQGELFGPVLARITADLGGELDDLLPTPKAPRAKPPPKKKPAPRKKPAPKKKAVAKRKVAAKKKPAPKKKAAPKKRVTQKKKR